MKKIIITALIAISIIPIATAAQVFEKDLHFGLEGNSDVQKLQEFLNDKGYYSGPITGNFFSLTLSAVKKFQTAQGITPISGYFGPKSRAKANEVFLDEGISGSEITNESGSVTPVPPTNSKAQNTVTSLMAQIELLQQKLNALKQQQASQVIQQEPVVQASPTPPAPISTPIHIPTPTPSPLPVPAPIPQPVPEPSPAKEKPVKPPTKTLGTITVSVDPSSPKSIVAVPNEKVIGSSFRFTSFNDSFTVQEAGFRVSANASGLVKNATNGIIMVDFSNIHIPRDVTKKFEVFLDLGDLSDMPASGISLQLTNTYAKYIRSDGTTFTTNTPGPDNTQAVSAISITR